jgi:hypothetical protein
VSRNSSQRALEQPARSEDECVGKPLRQSDLYSIPIAVPATPPPPAAAINDDELLLLIGAAAG